MKTPHHLVFITIFLAAVVSGAARAQCLADVGAGNPVIWRLDGGAHDPTEMGHNFYYYAQLLLKE
jgi:hypothetical protein